MFAMSRKWSKTTYLIIWAHIEHIWNAFWVKTNFTQDYPVRQQDT
jgi:hypothetical protein